MLDLLKKHILTTPAVNYCNLMCQIYLTLYDYRSYITFDGLGCIYWGVEAAPGPKWVWHAKLNFPFRHLHNFHWALDCLSTKVFRAWLMSLLEDRPRWFTVTAGLKQRAGTFSNLEYSYLWTEQLGKLIPVIRWRARHPLIICRHKTCSLKGKFFTRNLVFEVRFVCENQQHK